MFKSILDKWAIKRAGSIPGAHKLPPTRQERAEEWAAEHPIESGYVRKPDGTLNLTSDGYPVPKWVSPDTSMYWGDGIWS